MIKNLTNVKEMGFITEEGRFKVRVVKIEDKSSKAGSDMTEITCERADGLMATLRFVWTEKSMPFIKRDLRNIGFDVDGGEIDLNDLMGCEIYINVKYQLVTAKDPFGAPIGEPQKADYPNITVSPDQTTPELVVAPSSEPVRLAEVPQQAQTVNVANATANVNTNVNTIADSTSDLAF